MQDYLDPINSVGMPELTDSGLLLSFYLQPKRVFGIFQLP